MADTKSPKAVSSPKAASSKDTSPRSPKSPARSPEGATIHEEEHASIDAEVNFGDGDGDSAVGDSVSIYTTSLASSVLDYPVEHGRRYHAYQHGRYTRPNDEQEMDRLLIMHSVVTEAIGGLYRAPIDETKPLRILDIGTGSGIWAVEVGEQLPNATIIGTDLSANMPTFVPPNVVFEVDDVENEWVFEAPFDYIFSRYMVASIADWPKLVARTFANLIPGGWAEFQDFDLTYHSDDGSLQPDDPLLTWIETGTQAAAAMGRDPLPGRKLAGWFGDAGFSNIVHRRYKLPLGPWPRDPVLKRIGLHNYMQLNQGLEGMSLRLYTQVLGWTEQQVLVMLTQVRQSLHNPNIHPILDFHVVYGQKPE